MNALDHTASEILDLAGQLVRIPTQGGLDPLEPAIDRLTEWFTSNRVVSQVLRAPDHRPIGVLARVKSGAPGPHLCLDAPIDTAPAGPPEAWRRPPFEGAVEGGRLHGRGAADCKMGVSVLCHLARAALGGGILAGGTLDILLDGDEHTGGFAGVRAYVERDGNRPDFAAIAYPGNEAVVRGARGFWRGTVRVYGVGGHSGARVGGWGGNAIGRAARFVESLRAVVLPRENDREFSFGPSLTVTQISGGTSFSQIPGHCDVGLDLRLTPSFGASDAERVVVQAMSGLDASDRTLRPSRLEPSESWPCYRLAADDPWVLGLARAASGVFGRDVPSVVCGPSNVGNYFHSHGVPATCGFGVGYERIHAPDEAADISTIRPVYDTYVEAVRRWSSAGAAAHSDRVAPRRA